MMTGGKKREVYIEIDSLDEQFRSIIKEYQFTKEKLHKQINTYEQLLDWGVKIVTRLAETDEVIDFEIPSGPNIANGKDSLTDLFEVIAQKVRNKLAPVLDRKEEVKEEILQLSAKKVDEIMEEVSHTEFQKKNVRVRPGSAIEVKED